MRIIDAIAIELEVQASINQLGLLIMVLYGV
jgi:hypothetical protein